MPLSLNMIWSFRRSPRPVSFLFGTKNSKIEANNEGLSVSDSHLETRFKRLFSKLYPSIALVHDEVKPVPKRRFRLDFAHPPTKVGIEISGGIWRRGAHSSGTGIIRDYEKMNLCQINGWVVFQLTARQINADWCEAIAKIIVERLNDDQ